MCEDIIGWVWEHWFGERLGESGLARTGAEPDGHFLVIQDRVS